MSHQKTTEAKIALWLRITGMALGVVVICISVVVWLTTINNNQERNTDTITEIRKVQRENTKDIQDIKTDVAAIKVLVGGGGPVASK